MLILKTGLQDRAAHTSPGYSQSLAQTRSPESLTYVYQTPLFLIKSLPGKPPCHTQSCHRRAASIFGSQR